MEKQLFYIAWHPDSSWTALSKVDPADYNLFSIEDVCNHLRQTWTMHLNNHKNGYGAYYIS